MSVVLTRVDASWLTLQPAAALTPRAFGQPAGLFFAGISVTGDASGGQVLMQGALSFEKKQEFFYEWMGVSATSDNVDQAGDRATLELNTGPRINSPDDLFSNVVMRDQVIGLGDTNPNLTVWTFALGNAGLIPMIAYGDKSIPGVFVMVQIQYGVNDLADEYFLFGWGFYYRYQTLFRGVPPGRA